MNLEDPGDLKSLQQYVESTVSDGYFDDLVMQLLQVLMVLRRCGEQDNLAESTFYEGMEDLRESLQYLNQCIATIEIFDSNRCKFVYFPLAPLYACLSDLMKDKIMH